MWSPETLVIVLGTFLLAGVMKGVVGLGLPTVSLAILSATLGHKEAIALILVPSLLTNVWQGLAGGAFLEIMRRLWALFAMALLGTWLGVGVLAGADSRVVAGFFGARGDSQAGSV